MKHLWGIFLGLLLLAPGAFANNILFGPPITKSVTSVSSLMVAKNSLRSYLIIVNTGSVTAYVKFGSAQSGTEGVPIPAGGNYEPFQSPANAVYADTASSSTTFTILEGQ